MFFNVEELLYCVGDSVFCVGAVFRRVWQPGRAPSTHFEVAGETQVLAVQLDGVRGLTELRELLLDSYLEVFDVELAPKPIVELEDERGGFVRLEDSTHIKQGKLLTALSIHVTAALREA